MSRITKRTTYAVDGLPVPYEPLDGFDHLVTVSADGLRAVVTVVTQAEGTGNPLEESDGEGSIYHHPRANYGDKSNHSQYLEALSLDGDYQPDLDLVQDAYLEQYTKHLETADLTPLLTGDLSMDDLRQTLINCVRQDADVDSDTDYIAHMLAWEHWGSSQYPDEVKEAMLAALETGTFKTAQEVWEAERAAGRIGNPNAVLLSCYEHGGIVWNIQGEGMNCRWDSSNAAAVWVPDSVALDNIDACLEQDLQQHGGEWPSPEFRDQRRAEILTDYARSCVKTYSDWVMGYVYYISNYTYERGSVDEPWQEPDATDDIMMVFGYEGVEESVRAMHDGECKFFLENLK